MGFIIDGDGLHGEAKWKSFAIYTDFGDQRIELSWEKLPELRRVLQELVEVGQQGGHHDR